MLTPAIILNSSRGEPPMPPDGHDELAGICRGVGDKLRNSFRRNREIYFQDVGRSGDARDRGDARMKLKS